MWIETFGVIVSSGGLEEKGRVIRVRPWAVVFVGGVESILLERGLLGNHKCTRGARWGVDGVR